MSQDEERGDFDKIRYSNIKCKNFELCQNYIPNHLLKECEQLNGDYLCEECFQQQEQDEREEKRFREEK